MKRKIAFALCIALLLSFVCVLYVGAEPTTTPPSNLTGYTVTFSEGFSKFPSSEVTYNITGSFTEGSYADLFSSLTLYPNLYVVCHPNNNYLYGDAGTFSFSFTGGDDVSNSSFIQWCVDNNATFDNGSSPDPDPDLFPVAGGFYAYDIKPSQMPSIDSYADGNTLVYPVPAGSKLYLNEAYNVNRGTEIPIQGIVIQFANITNSNNYHIKVGVWYSDDAGFVPENVFTIVCTEGTFTKVNRFSFSRFYFSESVSFDEWGYQFFNAVFVPSDQPVPIFEGSPIAYIISTINDALRTDIFGTYSIMDMVTIFVSLSLLIWVLKMLAGG